MSEEDQPGITAEQFRESIQAVMETLLETVQKSNAESMEAIVNNMVKPMANNVQMLMVGYRELAAAFRQNRRDRIAMEMAKLMYERELKKAEKADSESKTHKISFQKLASEAYAFATEMDKLAQMNELQERRRLEEAAKQQDAGNGTGSAKLDKILGPLKKR